MIKPEALGSRPRLWTRAFAVLCLTVSLGYTHHALMLPTIPLYVDENGGSALFAGIALMSFSAPSFLIRPYLGRLADNWSPSGVLTLGLLLMTLGGAVYFSGVLGLIFVAALMRGFGWAGLNTGGYTLLAGAAPDTRRGEASGYYTSATASAVVFFPAVAIWLIDAPSLGFTAVFAAAVLSCGLGWFLSQFVLGPMVQPRLAPAPAPSGTPAGGLIDRTVLPATLLNLCSSVSFPAVTAFLPLFARDLGIGNIAIFYILAGVSSALIRPLLGSKSDSIGRAQLITAGFLLQLCGFACILVAQGLVLILAGGVIAALGNAIVGSATTALAMDLARPEQRGRAMATFSLSFQMGQGTGAIIAGALADFAGLRSMYAGSMALVGIGFLVLALSWKAVSGGVPQAENSS